MIEKQLIVIGGPNGSGKSTLAREILREKVIRYISADDIACKLNPDSPETIRIQAGKEFFKRLNKAAEEGENILIESTLSGKSLISLLDKYSSEFGYSIIVVFVYVSNVDVCAERVAIRVQKGGHDVPLRDIKRRFGRCLYNFWHHYRKQSDQWYLFYNAEDDFQEVARCIKKRQYVLDEDLFAIFKQKIKEYE
jgi:predicted ABC-type ATPase